MDEMSDIRFRMGRLRKELKELRIRHNELMAIKKEKFPHLFLTKPQNKKRDIKIRRERAYGATFTELAERYHISRERCRQICK